VPARIVQLTDLHLTRAIGGTARGQDVWRNLRLALADVRANREPLDVLVVTGDIANQRSPATYAQLAELLQPWRGRLRVLPGNHDSRALLREAFADLWLPECRSANFVMTLGGWRVIGLDSVRRPFVHGKLGKDQLTWLSTELGKSSAPTLLFLHHPLIRVGSWWLDKDLVRDRRALAGILAGTQVSVIASGHVHQEFAGMFAGAQFWTTPSTAYQFRPRSVWPARISTGIGYRVIDLVEDRVATQVIRLGTRER
jgi:Icc protein